MEIKYILYFLLGGLIVSSVTYLASHAKGLIAAFIANMPLITMITFLTIYFESGKESVISYASSLIIMLLPWLFYVFTIIFFTKRFGFLPSLTLGFSLYFIVAYLIIQLRKMNF